MEQFVIDRPKVTIGICVKNGAVTIADAIESLIKQDFPHKFMEAIFVDDGSEDNTLSVIQRYIPKLDMQVRLFHHQWKGLGVSRNVVVDNAAGDYIIWVDSDMTLAPDFVSRQVEFMKHNSETGVGKGQYGICAQDSWVGDLENVEFVVAHFRRREKTNSVPFGTGGSIYRVKAIRQVGGFDKHIKGSGEDVDAEFRLKTAGWQLAATSAVFYERRRGTWKSLWSEYFWHGKDSSNFFDKNRQMVHSYSLWPPALIAIELFRMIMAYKLTHRKVVLLLPIHYIFKRTAWFLGFVKNIVKKNHAKLVKI